MSISRRTFGYAVAALFVTACAVSPGAYGPPAAPYGPAAAPYGAPPQPTGWRKLRVRVVKVRIEDPGGETAKLPESYDGIVRLTTVEKLNEAGYVASDGGSVVDCIARVSIRLIPRGVVAPAIHLIIEVVRAHEVISRQEVDYPGDPAQGVEALAAYVVNHFILSPAVAELTKQVTEPAAAADDAAEPDDAPAPPKKKKKKKKVEPQEEE